MSLPFQHDTHINFFIQYKLRRTRLPLIANFLCTSDNISSDETSSSNYNPLSPPPRSHPPPLYYLPAILTQEQESFITRRKTEVSPCVLLVA